MGVFSPVVEPALVLLFSSSRDVVVSGLVGGPPAIKFYAIYSLGSLLIIFCFFQTVHRMCASSLSCACSTLLHHHLLFKIARMVGWLFPLFMKNLVWPTPDGVSAFCSFTPFDSFNALCSCCINFSRTTPDNSLFALKSKGSLSSYCFVTGRLSAFANFPTYA